MAKNKSRRRPHKKQANTEKTAVFVSFLSNTARSRSFRFAAAFTLSCVAFYALIQALPESITKPLNEHIARTLCLLLNTFGIPASTSGDIVSEKGLAFKIIPECTPIFMMGLFFSFVVFHPASMRQKATGLAMGIPSLYLGDLVRLVITFMVSRYDRRFFDLFHVYLGQIFTLLLVILCCLVWMRWVERGEKKHEASMNTARFLGRFGLISTGLFLIWIRVHHGYVRLLDWLIAFGFSLFGLSAQLAQKTTVYYETFSIVIVVSLVLAAGSVPWGRRVPMLVTGMGVLFLIHLFHRIDNALLALYNITAIQHVDLAGLVIGQYLVPALLLIYLVRLQGRENSAAPA